MTSSFERLLKLPEIALKVHEARTKILSSNISNQNTPNYKAKDLDFRAMIQQNLAAEQATISTLGNISTPGNNPATPLAMDDNALQYRVPQNNRLDGNTVDLTQELIDFADNTVRYELSLKIFTERINGLRLALKTNK